MNSSLILFALAPDWLISWVTTLWLISLGALIGLVGLLLLWAISFLVAPRFARTVPLRVTEGVMLPTMTIFFVVALFALLGALAVRKPLEMVQSIGRLPFYGERQFDATIPVDGDLFPVRIDLLGSEAVQLKMSSDGLMAIANGRTEEERFGPPQEIGPGTPPFDWNQRAQLAPLFGGNYVENLYVTNLSGQESTLSVSVTTGPEFPEVFAVPITAVAVLAVVLLYVLQSTWFPRTSAIALATTKSELAQPLFGILAALGTFLLILFLFLPYNTFGEDIKMLKDSGLTMIMVMGIVLGVWSASNSIAEEIEGRTALTVLSKPVSRRQFILGKVAGILWTVFLLFLILGLVLVIVVAYKPVYDAREMGSETPEWTISHLEVMLTIPGLVLAFFEATVLVCISVAISTRLPMLANFVICFSIYVLGHITPLIVQSQIQFAPVVFIGQFIATILPVLDHFNIQAAVAAGRPVPYVYLGWAFVYCMLYSGIAMLLALALFEDRDLA